MQILKRMCEAHSAERVEFNLLSDLCNGDATTTYILCTHLHKHGWVCRPPQLLSVCANCVRFVEFSLLQSTFVLLTGPQCVFSCAKEHRPLPKQGYTCCLAMDGVKVLASGFEMDEKVLRLHDTSLPH